jgi:hypothetical protein
VKLKKGAQNGGQLMLLSGILLKTLLRDLRYTIKAGEKSQISKEEDIG